MWDSVTVDRHSVSTQMVVMAEALHAGKASPYLEEVSISGGTNH